MVVNDPRLHWSCKQGIIYKSEPRFKFVSNIRNNSVMTQINLKFPTKILKYWDFVLPNKLDFL